MVLTLTVSCSVVGGGVAANNSSSEGFLLRASDSFGNVSYLILGLVCYMGMCTTECEWMLPDELRRSNRTLL
ncbi:hypothetical protein KC19_10G131900 [Ceratodon purpureus]|uniref:Uncharacterized protein n=1 Tax=Ceratodon purpureus TaxID=3225 RepID=A0A8T0GK07_CERPU|nr:hypothetical protein KC19_10G131900 [Ceratodon purpureus]